MPCSGRRIAPAGPWKGRITVPVKQRGVGVIVWLLVCICSTLAYADLNATYPAAHGTIAREILPPSPSPVGLAIGPDGLIYYTDWDLGQVICMDPDTKDLLWQIPHPDTKPSAIALVQDQIWTVGYQSRKLYVLSAQDGQELANYSLGDEVQPSGLAYGDGVLYVSNHWDWQILLVDPATGTVIRRLVAPERGIRGLAWDGHSLWCVSDSERYLVLMDPEREDWICRVYPDLPTGGLRGLDYYQGMIYTTNGEGSSRRISVLDPPAGGSEARVRLTKSNMVVTRMDTLKNHSGQPSPATTSCIIKPVSNSMQDVLSFETKPAAVDFTTEPEGNEYACVPIPELKQGEHFSVYSRVAYDQYETWQVSYPHQVTPLSTVPEDIARLYLRDDPLLQLNHATVQYHARQVAKGETNAFWLARNIVYYLADVMEDYGDTVRGLNYLGTPAPLILASGGGWCREIARAYVALARANQLPARQVRGAGCETA